MRRLFWLLLLSVATCCVAGCSDEECKLDVVECTCPQGLSHTDECTGVCVCEPNCVSDYRSECRENNRVGLIDCAGVCVQGATLPDAGNNDMSSADAGTTDMQGSSDMAVADMAVADMASTDMNATADMTSADMNEADASSTGDGGNSDMTSSSDAGADGDM